LWECRKKNVGVQKKLPNMIRIIDPNEKVVKPLKRFAFAPPYSLHTLPEFKN